MAKYVLLLRDEYYPLTPRISLSGPSGVELLGPDSVSEWRLGPYNAPFGCSPASNCRISTSTTRLRGRNQYLNTRLVG